MISREKLFEIFKTSKDVKINQKDFNEFYKSIKKSYILFRAGIRSFYELYWFSTNSEWPVLKKISNPRMDIYKDYAEAKILVNKFTKLIKTESKLRKDRANWAKLRKVIWERINLYPSIFKFTKEDIVLCKKEADILREEKTNKYSQS